MSNDLMQKFVELAEQLSLCLDEYGEHQGTHAIQNGRIIPKGSFIALVEQARELVAATAEGK